LTLRTSDSPAHFGDARSSQITLGPPQIPTSRPRLRPP